MTTFTRLFRTTFVRPDRSETPQPIPDNKAIAMIVDDEPAIRGLMAMSLRQCGYHVVEAAHGLAALDEAKRLQRVDLLIADLDLQGVPGDHVAENLRRTFTEVPVVFTTEQRRASYGQDPVMVKPFACGSLLKTVAETVGITARPPRLAA